MSGIKMHLLDLKEKESCSAAGQKVVLQAVCQNHKTQPQKTHLELPGIYVYLF